MSRKDVVLVVDDEPQITRVLKHALDAEDFDVRVAHDGQSGFDLFQASQPRLIITDLVMPGLDGIELCRRVRRVSGTPIIVLSVKGEEESKVKALDAGADDYMTKPFGAGELLARVRAILRRVDGASSSSDPVIAAGDFRVDNSTREVTVRGRSVHLTPKEYDLLLYFLAHAERVLTHRAILTAVWGANSAHQTEYLRVFVNQLRKKIEATPNEPVYLKTEPWIGYRFHPEG
jgi:two-component system KDP operon response regulator KdpE